MGDSTNAMYAKTGFGLVEWRRELCLGQLGLGSGSVDLGLPKMVLQEAVSAGVRSLIIGTAMIGGAVPDLWLDVLEEAASLGLDIVGGLHNRLNDIPRLKEASERSGARLVDVRIPPEDLPVGSGRKRSGKRILTVGTDCAVGKKYTALALERDMRTAGMNADFRASGQTGIMIAGAGIPIDAVVSDFVSGAAELLSPDNDPDHWDIIEGQGGLLHPGYGAVSLGLLTGSQPDAIVVCHDAGRTHIGGWPDFPIPDIQVVIDRNLELGFVTNPDIRCAGVSVNTSSMSDDIRVAYLNKLSRSLGLPCVDPLKDGTGPVIDRLVSERPVRGLAVGSI